MRKKEILELFMKMLGIFLLVRAVGFLFNVISVVTNSGYMMAYNMTAGILPLLGYTIIGFGLIKYSKWIAAKIERISGSAEEKEELMEISTRLSIEEIQYIAFSILGVYFMGTSLSTMLGNLVTLGLNDTYTHTYSFSNAIISNLIQFGFGFYLVFGAKKKIKRDE